MPGITGMNQIGTLAVTRTFTNRDVVSAEAFALYVPFSVVEYVIIGLATV
jgi:hypothetical protein